MNNPITLKTLLEQFQTIYNNDPQTSAKEIFSALNFDLNHKKIPVNFQTKTMPCVIHEDRHASVSFSKTGIASCWPCNIKAHGINIILKFAQNQQLQNNFESTGDPLIDNFVLYQIDKPLNALIYLIKRFPQKYQSLIPNLSSFIKTHTQKFSDENLFYQSQQQQLNLYRILEEVMLLSQPTAEQQDYLKKRGLTPEICKNFSVGTIDEKIFFQKMKEANISENVLIDEMMLTPSGDFNLKGIVYLSKDAQNTPVAFSCRSLKSKEELGSKPRFITSKNSSIYKKSDFIYGLNVPFNDDNFVCLTEGQQDAISLRKVGLNAIATMGIQTNQVILDQLKSLNKTIYLCWDGDQAGLEAMKNQIINFLNKDLDVRVFRNPYINSKEQLKDVDDIVQKRKTQTREIILNNSITAEEFFIKTNIPQTDSKIILYNEIKKLLRKLKSRNPHIIQNIYSTLKRQLKIDFSDFDLPQNYQIQFNSSITFTCNDYYQLMESMIFLQQHPSFNSPDKFKKLIILNLSGINQRPTKFTADQIKVLIDNSQKFFNWKQQETTISNSNPKPKSPSLKETPSFSIKLKK